MSAEDIQLSSAAGSQLGHFQLSAAAGTQLGQPVTAAGGQLVRKNSKKEEEAFFRKLSANDDFKSMTSLLQIGKHGLTRFGLLQSGLYSVKTKTMIKMFDSMQTLYLSFHW